MRQAFERGLVSGSRREGQQSSISSLSKTIAKKFVGNVPDGFDERPSGIIAVCSEPYTRVRQRWPRLGAAVARRR